MGDLTKRQYFCTTPTPSEGDRRGGRSEERPRKRCSTVLLQYMYYCLTTQESMSARTKIESSFARDPPRVRDVLHDTYLGGRWAKNEERGGEQERSFTFARYLPEGEQQKWGVRGWSLMGGCEELLPAC